MSTTTDYMGLVLYDPYNEDATTEGRVYVNTTSGVGTGSNMYKVNEYMKGKATVTIKSEAQWAADATTILRVNDFGLASDTNIMKRGDGTSAWGDLDAVDQTYANFVAAGYTGTQTEFYALLSSISDAGDMLKSSYDTDNSGVVDDAENLGGNAPSWYQQSTNGLAAEESLADSDTIPFYDESATANRKSTWTNFKAKLKAHFDDLYAALSHSHGNITNAGAIGTTSGAVVKTTANGVLTTGTVIAGNIANNAVTNAKSAKMAAYTLKGNNTNASADPQDITAANVRSMIDAQETMQYTAMPETVTNGTIIQYIGETTIVAPIYTNGHFYKGVDGVWQEIVYGDPNSVSYDAQSKTVTQKAQARTNIGAAASDHTHGNITDGGAVGTVSDCFLVTGAGGVAQAVTPHEAKALLNGGVHVYGVRWDMQNPSSELQRTGDAVGIGEPVPAVGALGGSSPFDQLEPWKSIRECNVLNSAIAAYKGDAGFTRDGTNGDVMVYFPAIYLKTYIESNRYYNIEIADGAKDGFAKIAGRNSFCLGKYKTVLDGTTHVSKTGVTPCGSITRAVFRTAARAKGTKWAQQDAAARFALAILYLVEYADFNSQAKIGRGFVDGNAAAALTGTTDALVYHTGMEQNAGGNGKAQIVYRGVESPWGNVWEFIDGININSGVPYICTNPENFADDTATNYTATGFTCAQASGWQKTLARDANIPWLLLPSVVGGSETSYVSDHYWYDAGWRLVLAGGAWSDGSLAGLLAWGANNVSSLVYAGVGSRLLFLP